MSAAAGNPGLRYSMSKPVGAKYRSNADSRPSFSGFSPPSDMPPTSSRSNWADRTDNKSVLVNRRDTRTAAKDDDVIAVKDVEYIDSFPVVGDDQSMKTNYVRNYLLDSKNTSRTKPVQLIISLSEIRIYDDCGEVPIMAHALKRIAFATCSPEYRHFSFVAREPKGSTDDQYCHAFLARSADEAEELNKLVANAFRKAYAQSQSPAGQRDQTPPSGQPARTSSAVGQSSNPPLTPIPISGSPALTFQDMLRGSHRDSSMSTVSGSSWSPAHSFNAGGGQMGGTGGGDELSVRLLQISTPSVDQIVMERRHRRNADHGGSAQPGGVSNFEDITPSHVSGLSSAANGSPPSSRDSKSVDNGGHRPMANSESSASSSNGSAITRPAVQPAGCVSTTELNTAFDTMLMSNLLRTLKFCGSGDSRPHGSPVMILKELIDFHFVNRALNEDLGIIDRTFPPTSSVAFTGVQQQQQTFSPPISRSDANIPSRKCPPTSSSRSRPLSGIFSASNGDSHNISNNRNHDIEITSTVERSPRMESLKNGEIRDDDLSKAAWYQPGLPRETILDMLVQQDVGAFVVRDSTTHAGCYALSIRVPKYDNEAGISHYLITKTPRGTVRLKGMAKEWNSLTALVTHHTVMRELLPCLLVMPKALPINGYDRFDRMNSEC